MKKIVFTLVAAALITPALAQEEKRLVPEKTPATQSVRQAHEAFQKERQEHRQQMKALQEKMKKRVEEYNKLKPGKKKDAKRAELEKEVAEIHQEQLLFKEKQLGKFEERLGHMRKALALEKSEEGNRKWVSEHTDKLIAAEGNVRVLFAPNDMPFEPQMGGPRGPRGPKGGLHKGGPKGFLKKGGKQEGCPCEMTPPGGPEEAPQK